MSKKLLNQYDLRPKKRFGQNFLTDQNILRKIAAQNPETHPVVEFGPGLGALTELLIDMPQPLYAVEFDPDMVEVLTDTYGDRLKLTHGDATKVKLNHLIGESEAVIFGNLPYNVSSQIIFNLIDQIDHVHSCYFMLQKEVAKRLVAPVGKKDYGIFTLSTDLYFTKKILFDVKPNCFYPPPNVDSAIIEMKKDISRGAELLDHKIFRQIVKETFGQRRKMLRNTLKKWMVRFPELETVFPLTSRPEQIDLDGFIEISNHITKALRA